MELFNNSNILLAAIPVLTEQEFHKEIVRHCLADARLSNFFGIMHPDGGVRLLAILAYDEESRFKTFSMVVSSENPQFESLVKELPCAHLFEREIAEQWAITPVGHPWLKPLRYHSNYRGVSDIWPDISKRTIPGAYSFFNVDGEEVHEVAVGPVHAGIIEPGHFRFQCHGEEVMHLEIQLGYQHRGIESLMLEANLKRSMLLSESIAGDTSVGHSIAFCEIVESLSNCVVPARAQAVRAIALELERCANHVGDLGALSMDAGFLPASAYFGRMRGDYLNLLLALTGNRFGKGICRPGGVLFDIDVAMQKDFCEKLACYKKEFEEVSDLLFTQPSVMDRFEGIGIVSTAYVKKMGFVGPVARASHLERDIRIDHSSGLWQFYHIPISLAATGDIYARALVRRQEVVRSIDFLLKILSLLPHGDIFTQPNQMKSNSLAMSLVEGWRGEIMHVGITDNNGVFARYKIKDPSFNNWAGLSMAMRNQEISDFPLCNKSFSLSYCGHDL